MKSILALTALAIASASSLVLADAGGNAGAPQRVNVLRRSRSGRSV